MYIVYQEDSKKVVTLTDKRPVSISSTLRCEQCNIERINDIQHAFYENGVIVHKQLPWENK